MASSITLKRVPDLDGERHTIEVKPSTYFSKYIYHFSACLSYIEQEHEFKGILEGGLDVVEPVNGRIPWMQEKRGIWIDAGQSLFYPDAGKSFILLDSRLKNHTDKLIGTAMHEFIHWSHDLRDDVDVSEHHIQKETIRVLEIIVNNYQSIISRQDLFEKESRALRANIPPKMVSREQYKQGLAYAEKSMDIIF